MFPKARPKRQTNNELQTNFSRVASYVTMFLSIETAENHLGFSSQIELERHE